MALTFKVHRKQTWQVLKIVVIRRIHIAIPVNTGTSALQVYRSLKAFCLARRIGFKM